MVLQQVFALLTSSFPVDSGNGTIAGTPVANNAAPQNISSLITLLFSFSALRDWLKLIVIGGFFESCRRMAFSAYYKLIDSFFITVQFEEDDSSYDWMMVWLSKRPSWSKARQIQVSTKTFGLNSSAVAIPGDEDVDPNSIMHGTRKLAYLPSVSATYTIWYKRRWMSVTRVKTQSGGYYGGQEETLQISIFTRSHSFVNELLLEAKREYLAAQEHNISIYVSDSGNNWRYVASRPKRSLNSIVLDPGIKDLLVDDARDFLESKSWYAARGIPFRRGYLLYGAPGSGKTSIIHSMAGELGLDVYVLSLSRVGLDDTALGELISQLPEKCIALMEDIDAAFSQTLNRDADPEDDKSPNAPPAPGGPPGGRSTSRISLSGLLNALDGVGAQEGRILYATTNKYTALDPALCRPGRMDLHVEFKLASKYQAGELFKCFYLPESEVKEAAEAAVANTTTGELKQTETKPTTTEKKPPVEAPSFTGRTHRSRPPKLSEKEVAELAQTFTAAMPEREFSMASLQGYLMTYKTRPFEAVNEIGNWIETQRREAKNRKPIAPPVTPPMTDEAVVVADHPPIIEVPVIEVPSTISQILT